MQVAEQDFTLRDGRRVHLRAMRTSDEAEFLQAFERLSPDARYTRFMRQVKEPDLPRLRRALADLVARGVGIVATVPAADGIDIVGSTVCVAGEDATRGEFAITVAGDYAGTGLGGTLMRALIEAARRKGMREMEGFVLAGNASMLRLAKRVGFTISVDPEDRGVRVCRLTLA